MRLERTVSWSQTRRDTNFAIPGYSISAIIPRRGRKSKIFCLWSFMWSKPLLCCFRQSGKILQTQASQGFATFRSDLSRIQPRHSQMCVGTFSRHSSVLFGPFLCLGSSSLELFCPACFKKPFRLLGFVWDWILCIKRCSARFEGQWQAGSPQWRGAGIASHKQRIKPVPPAV